MARSPEEIDRIVQRTIAAASRQLPLTAVYLFGSYSDGTARPDSDIDIALFSPAARELSVSARASLLTDIRLEVKAEIELHLFSDQCLREARPSNLYGLIVSTGRRVA